MPPPINVQCDFRMRPSVLFRGRLIKLPRHQPVLAWSGYQSQTLRVSSFCANSVKVAFNARGDHIFMFAFASMQPDRDWWQLDIIFRRKFSGTLRVRLVVWLDFRKDSSGDILNLLPPRAISRNSHQNKDISVRSPSDGTLPVIVHFEEKLIYEPLSELWVEWENVSTRGESQTFIFVRAS